MPEENGKSSGRKKVRAFAIAGVVALIALIVVLFYRSYAKTHIKTDDAFVQASIHIVAPRVTGTVLEVLTEDNQPVKKGDLLVRLDPQPFEQALAEAKASLGTEQSRLTEAEAQVQAQGKRVSAARAVLAQTRDMEDQLAAAVSARQAEVREQEASLAQSKIDLARAENLAAQEVIPRSRLDRAKTAFATESASLTAAGERRRQAESVLRAHASSVAQALAQVKAEEASLERVNASLKTQKEQIARRQAQVDMAELTLSYTRVTAPADGQVTRKSTEVGNTVQAGQPLLSVVSLDDAYILANYKETRLERIRPGQEVRIKLDAYPGQNFKGRVDSIMAGAGSAFTLFPPENASGNYVKVVQRVPVKITFEDLDEARAFLKVGISVVPTILAKD